MASAAAAEIKALIQEDKLAEAERLTATQLSLFRGTSDLDGISAMLLLTAQVALDQGNSAASLKAAREAWAVAKGLGQKQMQAEVLFTIVKALNMQGSAKEALKAARTSLPVCADSGDRALEAGMHHAMAVAHLKLEDVEDAIGANHQAMAIYKALGDKKGEATSVTTSAKALRMLGRFDEAITQATEAAALWRALGLAAGVVAALETIIDSQAAQGLPGGALAAAEEQLRLLQEAEVDKKNELIMMEKVAQVASEHGHKVEELLQMEEMINICIKAGDKLGEAQKTREAAHVHADMNHSQDALRLAKEAEKLFLSLGLADDAEAAKKLQTTVLVKKGQHNKAPHRSDALFALKSFIRAAELRDIEKIKTLENDLDKYSSAIKDTEMSSNLESLFERDPQALTFLEDQGWDLASFKKSSKVYQYPHKGFYLATIAGGMNFGPQFRGVHPYRKGTPAAEYDARVLSVCQLAETEAWQGQILYRHGIMDAGIQSGGVFGYPPHS